jgi:hypothetical protein
VLRSSIQKRRLGAQDEQTMLGRLASNTGKAFSDVLWGLDTPGAVVRSGIDYLQDGEWNNPLDGEQRVSGEDILANAGMESATGKFVGGAIIDAATDPLSYLTGGIGAVTKAGKAAKMAGMLDDVAEVASRSLQNRVKAGTATLGGRAQRTLDALDTNIDDFIEHSSRPLVGQRTAMRGTTLDDLVQHADQGQKDALDAFLKKKGWDYDEIKGESLGKSFGLAGTSIAFDPLGSSAAGQTLAAGMDRLGEAARWSKPGLMAHAYFNKGTGGAEDAITQAAALRINKAADAGEALGNRNAADLAYDLKLAKVDPAVASRTGISDVFSSDAAEAIDRYIEKSAATANDIDFVENTPGVKAFVDKWGTAAPDLLARSESSGLRSHRLNHAYGAEYRPYQMESALDASVRDGSGKAAAFDLVTGDMLKRKKALQLPGGLDQLRALSQDKRFVGLGDKFIEDDVAKVLFDEINDPTSAYYQKMAGSPVGQAAAAAAGTGQTAKYSMQKAKSLARFLHGLPADGGPVFGNHPAEAVARYMAGRERAISTSDALIDTVASRIVNEKASRVLGGRHITAGSALSQLGLRSTKDPVTGLAGGAAQRLREAIAAKTGVAADTVKLSELSIPVDAINNIRKMHDMFATPKAKGAAAQFLDNYTKVFKAQVLSWPSRFTRDFLSGGIGNMIEAGPGSIQGAHVASQLLSGNDSALRAYLRTVPLYKDIPGDDAMMKAFMQDAAESRILGGLSITDRHAGDRTAKALQEIIPGGKDAIDYQPNRSWGEFAWNLADITGAQGVSWGNGGVKRTVSNNPLFATGEKLGERLDSINRLGGYLAMVKSGHAPRVAADRMRAVHVAYDSLSPFEKGLRDSVFPFWAYTSRIGKYVTESMASRPGGALAQWAKFVDKSSKSDEDFYMPTTMREKQSLALPEDLLDAAGLGALASPGPGQRRVLTNLDIVPGSALTNLFAKAAGPDGTDYSQSMLDTASNVGQQLAPHLRTGIEAITQQDLHTKRPLGEVPTEIETILGSAMGDEDFRLPTAVNTLIDLAAPGASRVLSAGRQIADPRVESITDRLAQTAANQVLPFRVAVVDEKRQRGDAMRQIDTMLRRDPASKSFETVAVAKEDFDRLSPAAQQLYLLKQGLADKARKEKKAKQRAARFRTG